MRFLSGEMCTMHDEERMSGQESIRREWGRPYDICFYQKGNIVWPTCLSSFSGPFPPFPQYHHIRTTITGLDGNPPQHFYRLPMQRWTTGVLQASHQGTDHDKATGPTPRYHMPKKKARLEDADHLVCCPELKSQNISCYTTFKWNRDKEARAWTQ